jgi:hypothetical protein
MLRLNVWQNGSTHNLSLSQQEGTFSQGDSRWTCADPRIRYNRLLDGHIRPWRVSLEGSERRAAFRSPPDVIDNAILQALNQTSFASVRELSKSMCISCETVWRRLTGSLGLLSSIYICIAIRLRDAQWQIRIDWSNKLSRLLECAQANDRQSFMTLDGS